MPPMSDAKMKIGKPEKGILQLKSMNLQWVSSIIPLPSTVANIVPLTWNNRVNMHTAKKGVVVQKYANITSQLS